MYSTCSALIVLKKTGFISKLLTVLQQRPFDCFENVHKVFAELTEDRTSQFVRDLVLYAASRY